MTNTDLPIPVPTPSPSPEVPGEGWKAQQSNAASTLTSISAVNGMKAWTAGWTAGLRRTADGGSTWMPSGQSYEIKQVQFLDDQNGWAITSYFALSTSDGGNTWSIRMTATQNPLSSLSFVSATDGWVTAQNYEIFKTRDGGETWSSTPVAPPPNGGVRALRRVHFVDSETGWILTSHHEGGEAILRTTDGGDTWEQKAVVGGTLTVLNDIAAVGADHAWVVGAMTDFNYGELILATTDGGESWAEQHSDSSSALLGVHFVDENTGWAVGRKIHHTSNGGATWTVQATVEENFSDVFFINETTGWVVGANGIILKTTTGGE